MAAQTRTLKVRWGGGVLRLTSPNTKKEYVYSAAKDAGFLRDVDPADVEWLLGMTYAENDEPNKPRQHYFSF